MADEWREGARSFDPLDECPGCGVKGRVAFASDFKMMGKHSIRASVCCGAVYDNGKLKGPLTVHKEA